LLFPEEVVANRVVPTLRMMVARDLGARGLTEREIAQRLGLTQSAVSKYLRGRLKREAAVEESPSFRALAARLAKGLADEQMTGFEALGEALAVIRKEEERGVVCALHEEVVPGLAGLGCDLCVRAGASDLLADQHVLGDLRVALRTLEAEPGFHVMIPNVGSNLARAREGAQSALDVAAVPGRIFEMRGAVRVPAAPEFGASRHVAEVVLAVMRTHPSLRAALNVRLDAWTMAAAKGQGWSLLKFDSDYEGRADRIARSLRATKGPPDGLYHEGGFGVEPILYLVGRTAQDAVAKGLALARAMSAAAQSS
jgi:hypothetical protein